MAFDMLPRQFDRLRLCTNVCKTVGMVCIPCRADRVRSDEAYTRRITGEGRSFKEQHQEQVLCPECGKDMVKGSLVNNRQTQHGVARGGLGTEGDESARGNKPRTYSISFPAKARHRPSPFKGCRGHASTRKTTRVHFWRRHFRNTVVVLEEGNLPHPWCPLCDMLVPWRALNGKHRHKEK